MKIPNRVINTNALPVSLARIVSEDSQLDKLRVFLSVKSSKDS